MAEVPDDRRYTKEHEWVRQDGGRWLIGITDYAQDQLGDVVFVGLPEVGSQVTAGQPLGEVESTKSVSDVYSPVNGKVIETNAEVEARPELVNEDPYGSWLVAVERSDEDEGGLLDAAAYRALTEDA